MSEITIVKFQPKVKNLRTVILFNSLEDETKFKISSEIKQFLKINLSFVQVMDILLTLKTALDFLDVLMVIFGLNFAQLLYFGTKVNIYVIHVIEFLLWGVKISFRFLAQTEHTYST